MPDPKKKRYQLVSSDDPQDVTVLEAATLPEASSEALEVLGYAIEEIDTEDEGEDEG